MYTKSDFDDILKDVKYGDWKFVVGEESRAPACSPRCYLQVRCNGVCNVTGKPFNWSGRKWLLSSHMTKSEVVQTAFKAVLTAVEHEARERFTYMGQAIFDPHYNVDLLVELRKAAEALAKRAKT